MVESVFMAELSWPEFAAKVAEGVTVFLPLGTTEQHGPHMAMNVDVVLPTAVCERVARNVGGIVAPTIPYGYKSQPRSGGGEVFPGTTSLDANTFSLVVRDVIRSLGTDGVRRLVVVNGHFENCWPAVEGVDLRGVPHDCTEGLNVHRQGSECSPHVAQQEVAKQIDVIFALDLWPELWSRLPILISRVGSR